MTFKILLACVLLSFSSLAGAVQITTVPLSAATLSYNENTGKVYATGTLHSGTIVTNSLSTVTVNSDLTGKFEVDEKGFVRLAMKYSGAFLVGKTKKDASVVLDVPFQAFHVSERYDALEKSLGQVDVDYLTLDIQL